MSFTVVSSRIIGFWTFALTYTKYSKWQLYSLQAFVGISLDHMKETIHVY